MLPTKAIMTRVESALNADLTSDKPVTNDMPLYAVLRPDGQFEILNEDIEDTPRYTLTDAGREELSS